MSGFPSDEPPLDYFVDLLRKNSDAELARSLAEVAVAALMLFLARFPSEDQAAVIPAMSRVLSITERIPARSGSESLFWLCRSQLLKGIVHEGRDLHRQALLGLALDPPKSVLTGSDLVAVFRQELIDARYAVAAFTGLRRLALGSAIEHIATFLHTAIQGGIPLRQPLWGLFRTLDRSPSEARHLGQVLRRHPNLQALVRDVVANELRGATKFPNAWPAYAAGLTEEATREEQQMRFIGPGLPESVITEALERLPTNGLLVAH